MRVKAGEYQKEIPARFARAVSLLTLADWEKPEKIRLTPMERFKFAEAAWRVEQPQNIQDYLKGYKPEQIVIQTNRDNEQRYIVRYRGDPDAVRAQAVVPLWVFRACPKDKWSREELNWYK